MQFPRAVFHKDYKTADDEKTRENRTRVCKSEAELKELGPHWSAEHPEHKAHSESKAHVEPKVEPKKEEPKAEEKPEPKEPVKLKIAKAKAE